MRVLVWLWFPSFLLFRRPYFSGRSQKCKEKQCRENVCPSSKELPVLFPGSKIFVVFHQCFNLLHDLATLPTHFSFIKVSLNLVSVTCNQVTLHWIIWLEWCICKCAFPSVMRGMWDWPSLLPPPQYSSFYKLIQKVYINYYYVMIAEVAKASKKSVLLSMSIQMLWGDWHVNNHKVSHLS